jgi:hypothetical protein
MSVSLPFCTPSPQLGRAQVPSVPLSAPVQILFAQSGPVLHFWPSAHLVLQEPPQSVSLSSASWVPSVQCAGVQLPLPSQTSPVPPSGTVQAVPLVVSVWLQVWFDVSQVKVLHVVSVPQSEFWLHSTQVPLPLQTAPPLSLQEAPAVAFPTSQQPEVLQEATTHLVVTPVVHSVLDVHVVPASPHIVVIEVDVDDVLVLLVLLLVLLLEVVMPPVPPSAPPALIRLRSTEATSSQPLTAAEATARAQRKKPVRMVVVLFIARTSQKESTPTAPPPFGPA